MSKKICYITLAALLILPMVFTGCNVFTNALDEEEEDDICPDTQVIIDRALVFSHKDVAGQPIASGIFSSDMEEIFCVFRVPDLCCMTLHVMWFYGDSVIKINSYKYSIPPTHSLTSPEGGFLAGDYRVAVFIGTIEIAAATFQIVQ